MHIEHTTHDAVRLRQRPHSSPSSSPGQKAKGSNDGELRRGTIQQAGSLSSTTKSKLRGDSMSETRTEGPARPVTLWPTVPGKGSEDEEEERRGLPETENKKRGGNTIGKSAFLRTKCEILSRLSRGPGRQSGDNDTGGRNRSRRAENNNAQSSSSQRRSVSTVPQQQSSLRRTGSTRRTHDGESFRGEPRRWERTTRSKSRPASDHHYSIYPSPPQTPSLLHSPESPRRTGTTRDHLSASSSFPEKLFPGNKDKVKGNENESLFEDQDQRMKELPDQLNRTGALKGKNLWRAGPLDPCRLCKTGSVEGMRGLCRECEGDFVRPETMVPDRRVPATLPSPRRGKYDFEDDEDGGQGDFEEEVKPPVPLKDKRTLDMAAKMRREGKEKVRDEDGNSTTEKRGRGGSMPDAASDPNSVTGKIDGRYWDRQDQALFIAREKEKTQRIIGSWGVRQERRERRRKKEDEEKKRRTSFYRFWDDIL